jgi:undecaprenyl-diphosphatase
MRGTRSIISGGVVLFIPVILALFYLLIVLKKQSSEVIVAALIAFLFMYLVAKGLSALYYDPRPFVVGQFVPLIPHAPDNGFPSDHTLFVSAIAAVIFAFERRLGTALFVIAFLVGWSRVGAGVHHLTDILGSMVIASVVTYIVVRLVLSRVWRHMPRALNHFLTH